MWGDGGDGDEGASGFLAVSLPRGDQTYQFGYTFRIVNPQPLLDENGDRKIQGSTENFQGIYITRKAIGGNTRNINFQTSSVFFNFQDEHLGYNIKLRLGTLSYKTQKLWQNDWAHQKGSVFPIFGNTKQFSGLNAELETNIPIKK